jgi:hypothetical protein
MRNSVVWIGILLLSILPLMGQGTANQTPSSNRTDGHHPPYTAEYRITLSRTLSNGTTVRQEATEIRALDSRGRLARKNISTSGSGHQTINFAVFDRGGRMQTNWTIPGVRVTVSSSAPPITSTCFRTTIKEDGTVNRLTRATDDLGTETIADIQAHGTRTTTTAPRGEYGNNAPVTSTEEVWVATDPSLNKLEIRRVSDHSLPPWDSWDQRSTELVNLRLGEPDASLFEPPPDYEVVTRT